MTNFFTPFPPLFKEVMKNVPPFLWFLRLLGGFKF